MSGFTDILKSVAPMIATAALGPFGGFAVKALVGTLPDDQQAAVGAAPNPIEAGRDAIQKAIEQGVLDMAKVKQAEIDFQLQMHALDIKSVQDLEALAAQDRDSARKMEVETKSWIPGFLAIAVTVGFFGILASMMVGDFKPQNNDALLLMLGSLGTAWASVISYYFGSSAGSDRKTGLLAQGAK